MQPQPAGESNFRLAVAGDRDPFAAMVRQHASMVFGIAVHHLRDEAAAEELAQDVFVELHRSLGNLSSAEHVTNWLRRVATHRCIDYSRRRGNRGRVPLEEVSEPVAPARDDDPMLAEKLRRLTATLPDRARAVVILRFQEDMEPAEIAGVLDMPVNTVKSHLQRSLAMLRKKLERTQVGS